MEKSFLRVYDYSRILMASGKYTAKIKGLFSWCLKLEPLKV